VSGELYELTSNKPSLPSSNLPYHYKLIDRHRIIIG